MFKIKYYFTADPHLGHANIIRHCNRPWLHEGDLDIKGNWTSRAIAMRRCEEMNKNIITRWNKRVRPGDIVYMDGDFCFRNSPGGKEGEGLQIKAKNYREQLNGDIIFIEGNHDKNNTVKTLIKKAIIKYGHHYICIVHDPKHYDPNFKINFVGHIHTKWKFNRIWNPEIFEYIDLINIGMDMWNFQPVTFEEIYKEYKKWTKNEAKIAEEDFRGI